MRTLAFLILLSAPAIAADEPAVAVVKKAIEAHGGADALNKAKAVSYKLAGEIAIGSNTAALTGTAATETPDKLRTTFSFEAAGNKIAAVQVVNGSKIRYTINDKPVKLGDAEKAELLQFATVQDVGRLTPLLGDKYALKLDKDEVVAGKPTTVIVVTPKAKGSREIRVGFDKETGRLAKTSRRTLGPDNGGTKEVLEETLYSDFKPVAGVQYPTALAITHDGAKFMTVTLSDVSIAETGDPKAFALED